jgi:DNA-binding response OmpR family regulator
MVIADGEVHVSAKSLLKRGTRAMEPKPHILYVEDEPLIAMAIVDVLQEAGFDVVHVDAGIAALARLDQGNERFVAVITDVRLPGGVDGWAIGQRARELSPQVPVVYVSGDSVGDWAAEGVPKSIMLQKPFANAQLVAAVATLINEAGLAPVPDGGPSSA